MSQQAHEPGEYPAVHDEAAPTPHWLPLLGLGLLGVLTLFIAYRVATAPEEPPAEVAAAPAEEAEAPAPQPAAAPAPAPAPAPQPAAAPTPAGADSFGREPGHEHYGHDHE